jgi:hypothetical protein
MALVTRVLATDCPHCTAENVSNLASEYQTGLKIDPPEPTTCVKCDRVFQTDYLYLIEKTEAEMNAIGGVNSFSFRV